MAYFALRQFTWNPLIYDVIKPHQFDKATESNHINHYLPRQFATTTLTLSFDYMQMKSSDSTTNRYYAFTQTRVHRLINEYQMSTSMLILKSLWEYKFSVALVNDTLAVSQIENLDNLWASFWCCTSNRFKLTFQEFLAHKLASRCTIHCRDCNSGCLHCNCMYTSQ